MLGRGEAKEDLFFLKKGDRFGEPVLRISNAIF